MTIPSTATIEPAVRLDSVSKTYGSGSGRVTALDDVTAALGVGSFTAIMGPSGSGKSTFLQCAAGLDQPSSGTVWLGETEITGLRESALTELRRRRIGFVFQAYNLMPSLNVRQNITLPLVLDSQSVDEDWFDWLVAKVGITDRLDHRPSELSGGQQQRVALVRSLLTRPQVLFADEPTGALDSHTSRSILELLRELAGATDQTVVMVTHDPVVSTYAERVLFLADGRLAGSIESPTADAVIGHMTSLGTWET